jgi:hypothetical protein
MAHPCLLSQFNREIIHEYGNDIFNKHLKSYYKHYPTIACAIIDSDKPNEELLPTTWYGRAWSWVNPWRIGEALGWGVGMTYGQQITQGLVGKVAEYVFREEIAQAQESGWSWFKRDIAQPAIIETFKLTCTPFVLPFVMAGLHFIGGAIVAAAFAAIGALYSYLKNRQKEELVLGDVYDLSLLIKQENNELLVDKQKLEKHEIEDLLTRTYEYNFCQELLKLTADKTNSWIEQHLIQRIDNAILLSDGHILTPSQTNRLENAKLKLQSVNPSKESRKIRKIIHLFAKHKAQHRLQQILSPSEHSDLFILCSDAKTCARLPGTNVYALIDPESSSDCNKDTILQIHNNAKRWAIA